MYYVLLVALIGVLGWFKAHLKSKQTLVDILILVLLSLTYGLRYDVGIDYLHYAAAYVTNYRFEILFWAVQKGFLLLHAPFWLFVSFWGVLLFVMLYLTSRYLEIEYYKLAIFFILTGVLFTSFNIMRQIVAASVVFYGYRYANEKRLMRYLLTVMIASMIHLTAIVFLPFYFLRKVRIHFLSFFLLLFLGVLLYYTDFANRFSMLLLPGQYQNYVGGRFDFSVSYGLGFFFYVAVSLILILNRIDIGEKIYLYYLTYSLGYSLLVFTLSSFIFNRMTTYCFMALPFLLSDLIKRYFKTKTLCVLNCLTVLGFLILFLSSMFEIYHGDPENLLYRTILSA